jgi:hypothetical protein
VKTGFLLVILSAGPGLSAAMEAAGGIKGAPVPHPYFESTAAARP